MEETKKKITCKVLRFAGGVALAVLGFIVISPQIQKYSNKVYKASVANDDIDFDSMGPEIVKKEANPQEEE